MTCALGEVLFATVGLLVGGPASETFAMRQSAWRWGFAGDCVSWLSRGEDSAIV